MTQSCDVFLVFDISLALKGDLSTLQMQCVTIAIYLSLFFPKNFLLQVLNKNMFAEQNLQCCNFKN